MQRTPGDRPGQAGAGPNPEGRTAPLSSPMAPARPKPTPADLAAAVDRVIPDILAPWLIIVFCGINPGLYSGAVGHHFARPGNRFWPALHQSGLTDRLLSPYEDRLLPDYGLGITNLVDRTSAGEADLTAAEIRVGGRRLETKIATYRPRCVAFLGLGAYRTAYGRPRAQVGPQAEAIGEAMLWVLPNPSGLNAHYRPRDFAELFGDLRRAVRDGATRPARGRRGPRGGRGRR